MRSRIRHYGKGFNHWEPLWQGTLPITGFFIRDNLPSFFGKQLHNGVQGYLTADPPLISFFRAKGRDGAFECFPLRHSREVLGIRITSADRVLVSTKRTARHPDGCVFEVPSLQQLVEGLRHRGNNNVHPHSFEDEVRCEFAPVQWCTNATTMTALDRQGRVFTYASDGRYPKCLGRPSGDPDAASRIDIAQPIPYLEHCTVVKIASGGYMSAALSEDGELFLWGQACPGAKGELNVLKDRAVSPDDRGRVEKDSNSEAEFVRILDVAIEGRLARVVDVSIGWGHILVAAEVDKGNGEVARAVLAAGEGGSGQLGVGSKVPFAEDFVEVEALRGKKIRDITCAGYSSFVVVEEED